MPTTGQTGLAASIAVNANVDPSQGGTLTRLRDGGIGDPGNSAYVANTTGAASFATPSSAALSTASTPPQNFDAASGGAAQGSLADLCHLVGQLARGGAADRHRRRVSQIAPSPSQTSSALSSATGVNLDEQLSLMLDLEHSYQSSAELMSTVNGMFTALFGAMQ